jgi:hypothetical protein
MTPAAAAGVAVCSRAANTMARLENILRRDEEYSAKKFIGSWSIAQKLLKSTRCELAQRMKGLKP